MAEDFRVFRHVGFFRFRSCDSDFKERAIASDDRLMAASHDYLLVGLSVLISILAAYTAVDLTERVRDSRGRAWLAWLVAAATVDGIGIWSMHYTGILALRLPVPILFDWPTAVLSLLMCIGGSAAALVVVSRGTLGLFKVLVASILMGGVGISGLYYTAMAAMRLPGIEHNYDSYALVILSVVLAITFCFMTLSLAFLVRDDTVNGRFRYHASTLIRGAANPVMHYTAMAAVVFVASNAIPDLSHAVNIHSLGLLGISIVPAMVLIVALMTSLADRLQKQRPLLIESFALRERAQRWQFLSRRVVEVQEEDRRRLARELHDEIGQVLSAVSVNLQGLNDVPDAAGGPRLEESINIVHQAIEQVRNLSLDLRPMMLDDLGLASTIRWYAGQQAQRAGFSFEFVVDSSGDRLAADLVTASYRVVQEALEDIVRHGTAKHVWIEFHQGDEELRLVIRDDGVGLDAAAAREPAARSVSFGVLGMRERVELFGGQIEIESRSGQGTTIRVRFPIPSTPLHPQQQWTQSK